LRKKTGNFKSHRKEDLTPTLRAWAWSFVCGYTSTSFSDGYSSTLVFLTHLFGTGGINPKPSMKLKFSSVLIAFLSFSTVTYSQTPQAVRSFPEDYVGKTITFKNVAFWPTLHESGGYYNIQIAVSARGEEYDFGFASLDRVYGCVLKPIAKQIIKSNLGGYQSYLYGTVTGRIYRTSKVFGSKYIFLITKIINHPLYEPENVVHTFSSAKQ
jgi:hypothetical protein